MNTIFAALIKLTGQSLISFLLFSISILNLNAQPVHTLTGTIIDGEGGQGIPFANIALFDTTGTHLLAGCAANQNGFFSLPETKAGSYKLMISAIGFATLPEVIHVTGETAVELGTIPLMPISRYVEDVEVVASRIKAVSSNDRTTYFINSLSAEVSNTGTDVLRLIPGITTDMQQNISLEGSNDILILVNGRERDRSFITQLSADRIDKIEILRNPPSKYEASAQGVINIILKKTREEGMEGQLYAEIPVSPSEVFLYPVSSVSYGKGKLNIFASYNGEMRYFNLTEKSIRQIQSAGSPFTKITTAQQVKQKNWVHRLNYGADLFLNTRNELNYYGYCNLWSQEHDGNAVLYLNNRNIPDWIAFKEDNDINRGRFNSLYFKHKSGTVPGNDISIDLSHYFFSARNSTAYTGTGLVQPVINEQKPWQNALNMKIDQNLQLGEGFSLNQGFQVKLNFMKDAHLPGFQYRNHTYAGYMTTDFSWAGFEIKTGLRLEYALSGNKEKDTEKLLTFLPGFAASKKISSGTLIKTDYRRGIVYPHIYQVHPGAITDDPYTLFSGNPDLKPEIRSNMGIELSFRPGNQFISIRLFYNKAKDAIYLYTLLSEEKVFVTRNENLGDIHQPGMQLSGTFSLGKIAGMNPYVRISDIISRPNPQFVVNGNRHHLVVETGVSAFARITERLTASVIYQYASPVTRIQSTYFSDALYFLSLERSFGKNWKAGITCALPFSGTFNYRGYEISTHEFQSHSEGIIQLSALPVLLKASYRFQTGHKRKQIERTRETTEIQNRKGF
jgi:outer membrane receptor protein involved in Fe transport